jgi:CarD family transcriptional regulator
MTDMKTENAKSYARGDWIVHPHYGVGRIEDIERICISEQENTYYRIKSDSTVFWIPVDQMDNENEQIRPITEEACFREAVEELNKSPKKMASNLGKRKSRIRSVTHTNNPIETARLIRDLRERRRDKGGLNQSERQALRSLTKRFLQEWAVCRGLTLERSRDNFDELLEKRRQAANGRAETIHDDRGEHEGSSLLETLIKQDERWARWLSRQVAKSA